MNKEEYLKFYGVEQQKKELPPPIQINISDTIAKKREELELKKLEMEIAKLSAPNTSMDYFKEMLQMQQQHFNQLLTMNTQQAELKREVELLKIGDGADTGDDFLASLIPLLPDIIKNNKTAAAPVQPPQEQKEEVNKMISGGAFSLAQVEEIKRKVKSGEITEEQFIADAIKFFPQLATQTERIKTEYKKIKEN